MLFVELIAHVILCEIGYLCAAHVFAEGDEFHFGRNDVGAGIDKLGDHLASLGTQNFPLGQGRLVEVE